MTRSEVPAESGRTYFFVARTSERKSAIIASAAGVGLVGLAVSSVITAGYRNPGPLDFFPLDEAAAKATIADLRLAE
jgi:hypothetical protein